MFTLFCLQGGLKAVVWTDTLQSFFTMSTVVVMSIIGTSKAGGLARVLEINKEGGIFDIKLV